MKLSAILQNLIARLQEPSTWAGLAVIASTINPSLNLIHLQNIAQAMPIVFGALAALIPETGAASPVAQPPAIQQPAPAPIVVQGGAVNGGA